MFEEIISIENLRLADTKARKGKLSTYGVKVHDRNREENIQKLHTELKEGTFRTSRYHIFKIYEPKEREIYRLPYYPDRIVHHAIMNVMEPIWMKVFTVDTYSCIKGRGIHGVVRKLKPALKNNPGETRYCLKFDIRKYYPSIDHAILKTIIRKKVKDGRLLNLLDEIIDSAQGVPIGNYLSQYFANLYLAYFDHWIKEGKQIRHYYRYADDIVILHPDKQFLHGLRKEIAAYLENNLNIEIKRNWQVFPVGKRGIDFVGYVFRHTHTLMRKTIKKSLCRAAAKLNKQQKDTQTSKQSLCSWTGWAKHCDSINLLKTIKHAS